MDRRNFGKLIAGTITAAGIPSLSVAEEHTENVADGETALHSRKSSVTEIAPSDSNPWELVILDAVPPHISEIGGMAAADIDGDGKTEVVIIGVGAIIW
jgi:hypothetical protein